MMLAHDYWNKIGVKKDFEDPVYFDKLTQFLTPTSRIVEYGCGYGRMLNMFHSRGYFNLVGFDFAEDMIERGKKENPNLDLRLLEKSSIIPCDTETVDVVIMSTVLCCMTCPDERNKLIDEIRRVLVPNGILYITDFVLCNHPMYEEKYAQGLRDFGKWGTYKTTENLVVCHYSSQEIFTLLNSFDIQWFEQFNFKTMNQNPAQTFHCIAKK